MKRIGGVGTYGRFQKELDILAQELQQSIQTRIKYNAALGSDVGHAARQSDEETLLKRIKAYLEIEKKLKKKVATQQNDGE